MVPLPGRSARRGPALLVPAVLLVLLTPAPSPAAPSPEGAPTAPVVGPRVVGRPVGEVPVGVWPLDPVPTVTARFDPPETTYGSGHRGVDLAGRPGQPVGAALPGRVTYAGPLAGRGVVTVDHGATRTTYQPVAAAVTVGDTVAAGDRLGFLEVGGSHCAPAACLHWGWIEGETYLDPLLLVGAGPVVLLPLAGGALPASGPRGGSRSPGGGARPGLRPAGGPGGRPAATGRS